MQAAGAVDSESSQCDSDGACSKPPPKRQKGKSKVWEKVAWFTRRSRSRESPCGSTSTEIDILPTAQDNMELELSSSTSTAEPSPLHPNPHPWLESSSSSDGEVFEIQAGCCVKKSRLYPNSEVIEQNCLRPSIARALFHQMETVNYRCSGIKPPKYAWQKKKRRNYLLPKSDSLHESSSLLLPDNTLSRAISFPSEIAKTECHCTACCSCTPYQRLMGTCPAHAKLSTSTTSLDTGLSKTVTCQSFSTDCSSETPQNVFLDENSSTSHSAHDASSQPVVTKSPIDATPPLIGNHFKSNSLPAYYRSPANKNKCKTCFQPYKSHLPICDKLLHNDSTKVCQCRANVGTDHYSSKCPGNMTIVEEAPKFTKDKVLADQFKQRFDSIKEWFKDFNDEQKNLVIKEILGHCELPQIHLLSLEMEPKLHDGCPLNCQDLLAWLPESIAHYILSFLDPVSLGRASAVCKSWYELSTEPSLWRRYCCQPKWRLSRSGEQKQLLNFMMPNGSILWKSVFAERYKLRHNWLNGKCNVRTFDGHTQGISCVQFDDTRIVSGSSDKTIKVWNIRTNSPWSVQTLVGHSGTVRCLHLEGNRLVSGSTDKTIKVWDLSTQQSWSSIACKVTMIGHLDTVRCIQVDDEKVVSGSYDKTLKVWGIRSGECSMTLRGHSAAVLCVQFDATKIISGSCDKTIKVWNFSGQCLMTLHGHHDAVTCLQFDDTRIVSGSLDCNLKFWDVRTGECSNTIDWKASEGHTGVVRCLQADSWRVVSASDDRTLKVWSLATGERLVTLRNHTDGVTCLQFNDHIIVSGSYDKSVKLWDFSSC